MLRNRLKNLLVKEDPNIANQIDVSEATTVTSEFAKDEVVREFADDPTPDHEIIDGIEKIYFSDMGFDASLHELEKLPEALAEQQLDKYRNTLRRQLQAVSRQLSKKILDNQSAYVRELDRVMDLELNLQKATSTCIRGRRLLSNVEEGVAISGLEVLAKNRRKLLLQKLLKSLRFIKTLQETDVRLKELLQETHYASAIQLCLECQQAAVTFHQYTCISELSCNLQEVLEQIEEQLDVALSKLCVIFNEKEYSKIQAAYRLLGKTQSAMDQLQMHFVNTINNVAITTLTEVIKTNCNKTPNNAKFQSLCEEIPLEQFIPSLMQLCNNFWKVMYSYKQTSEWHRKNTAVSPTDNESEHTGETITAMFDESYIKSKLEQGLNRVWQDIQQKIKGYLLSANFAYFKYDEFIKVLDIINRLINVGEEFCHKKSDLLQVSLRHQTENYFKAYHRSTLEELHMFLENEVWQLCPVKSSFTIMNMQEFYFLKSNRLLRGGIDMIDDDKEKAYFGSEQYSDVKSPFDESVLDSRSKEKMVEDLYDTDDDDDDDEDVADELKRDYVDENTGEELKRRPSKRRRARSENISENTPIITNTTLNVLRSFGKYMQMMTVLKPIAFDVIICMSQLFDYYLYAVYSFFARKSDGTFIVDLNIKLRQCLARIHEKIILQKDPAESEVTLKVASPNLSPMVDLSNSSVLYGFPHRLIGVESVVFISKQLRMVHQHLNSCIPSKEKTYLDKFFSQTVDICTEFRAPIYRTVVEKSIQYDKIRQMMSTVKWDLKEIMSQHSPYIDALVMEYQVVQKKLQELSSWLPLPIESVHVLWSEIILLTNQVFVEGFSNVKRCSNEGRALMLLDFQQYLIKIEKLTNVKPAPGRDFVENYIKAFYLSESELETWLKDHSEYTSKQLNNLVNCGIGSHIGKKMKQKLTGLLDELQEAKLKNITISKESKPVTS